MKLLQEVNRKWKEFIKKEHRPNWFLTIVYKDEVLTFSDYDDCFSSGYPQLLKDEYKEVQCFLDLLQKIDIEFYIFGNGVVGK